jgi:hypothetical protein
MRAVSLLVALGGCSFDSSGLGGSDDSDASSGDASSTDASGNACTQNIVFDAFVQFSFQQNPTPGGLWQYGSTNGFNGQLTLFTEQSVYKGLEAWSRGQADPNVVKNPTGVIVQHDTAPIDYPPQDYLHVHPGPSDEPCLLRWTAPTAGTYLVSAEFISLNMAPGATTGVHIVDDGGSLFDGDVVGPTDTESYSMQHDFRVGDVVDFVVTEGTNGYTSDSTGVQATLTLMCDADAG